MRSGSVNLYKFKFLNAGIAPLVIGKDGSYGFLQKVQRETFDVTKM